MCKRKGKKENLTPKKFMALHPERLQYPSKQTGEQANRQITKQPNEPITEQPQATEHPSSRVRSNNPGPPLADSRAMDNSSYKGRRSGQVSELPGC